MVQTDDDLVILSFNSARLLQVVFNHGNISTNFEYCQSNIRRLWRVSLSVVPEHCEL